MIHPTCHRGFTLIEILMALAILSAGILAVAALQGTGLRAASGAERMSQGATAAKCVAERLMVLASNHPDLQDVQGNGRSGLDLVDDEDNFADHRLNLPSREHLEIFWNVAEDDPAPGLRTVRVIARWEQGGREQRHSLEFIRADE